MVASPAHDPLNHLMGRMWRAGRCCRITFENAGFDAILAAVRSGLGITTGRGHLGLRSQPVGCDLPAPALDGGVWPVSSGHCYPEPPQYDVPCSIRHSRPQIMTIQGTYKTLSPGRRRGAFESRPALTGMPRRTQCRVRCRPDGPLASGALSFCGISGDTSQTEVDSPGKP